MTKLGTAIDEKASTAVTRFMAALAGARARKPITIPGLGLTAVMTLIGIERSLDIEGDVTKAMQMRGLEEGLLHQTAWELERARRVLPEAILDDDPAKPNTPLGTLAEWGCVAKEIIVDLWRTYLALSEEHDPSEVALTAEEFAELRDAIVKKNATSLRSFGVRRLTAYLLTTADPPASSPISRSEPGDTSPGS